MHVVDFISGLKPTVHGLGSGEACGKVCSFISMECGGPAFLCCGCEPDPAWFISFNKLTWLPDHTQLSLASAREASVSLHLPVWTNPALLLAICAEPAQVHPLAQQTSPEFLPKNHLRTNATFYKEDWGTKLFWRNPMLCTRHLDTLVMGTLKCL